MNIAKSISDQVRALYKSQADKAREIAIAKIERDEQRQVRPLDTDRRVRRHRGAYSATAIRKENQIARRRQAKQAQVDNVAAGQTRVMLREFEHPERVSPALVRNVELTAVRGAKAKTAAEHPDWSTTEVETFVERTFTKDMGLDGRRLITLEHR